MGTLMYLASFVYGGTECLKRKGDELHEDCRSPVITTAREVYHAPEVCNATGCTYRTDYTQKLDLPRMMSEKIPMFMVLATLMYLASFVYGGTECLKRKGDELHEDCRSLVITTAREVYHAPEVCNATG